MSSSASCQSEVDTVPGGVAASFAVVGVDARPVSVYVNFLLVQFIPSAHLRVREHQRTRKANVK